MPNIPTEILQEVFKQSLRSPLRAHEAYDFPWYLGHVCSEWRALFFSIRSTFWNRIEIEFDRQDQTYVKEDYFFHLQGIISFFLDCTDGAPFSFTFCMENCADQYGADLIFKLLLEHSEQWEEPSIRLWASELRLLRNAKGHFPFLRYSQNRTRAEKWLCSPMHHF